MKLIVILVASILAVKSCGFKSTEGSDNIITKEVSITDYTKIESSGLVDVIYEHKPGQPPYCRIEAADKLMPYITAEVSGDILKISNSKNFSRQSYKIYTNSQKLTEINKTGSGDFVLKGTVNSDLLNIDMKGSGSLRSDSIYTSVLNVNLRGSGDVNIGYIESSSVNSGLQGSGDIILSGLAKEHIVNLKGAGDIDAKNLKVRNVKCEVFGSGDVQVEATDSLDVVVFGSGDVEYYNTPLYINKSVKGSGKIKQKQKRD